MVKALCSHVARWTSALFPSGRLLLVACLLVGLAVPLVGSSASTANPAESSYHPFVSNGFDLSGQRLVQLDPRTLADDPDGASIDLGSLPALSTIGPEHPHTIWTSSADGSTLVGLEYRNVYKQGTLPVETMTLVVRDGWTGEERGRYPITAPVLSMRAQVSADGSTVVLEADRQALVEARMNRQNSWVNHARKAKDWTAASDPYGGDEPPMLRWYVYDTASGALRTTVDAAGPVAWGRWINPTGTRLYYLAGATWPPDDAEPATTRIVAHDLRTGAEIGQVDLSGVSGGDWQDEGYVRVRMMPGAALSPNGSTLAVVSPDLSQVTLIDTGRMAVERQIAVRSAPGMLERLGRWLGLIPAEAAAKGGAGTRVAAVYAPDGRHLYVFGESTEMSEDEPFERHGLGLTVIDLTNGEVVASAFPDVWFLEVLSAPDGRTLYTVQGTVDQLLQRIDAKTLEVEAERSFAGNRWFMLRTASSGT